MQHHRECFGVKRSSNWTKNSSNWTRWWRGFCEHWSPKGFPLVTYPFVNGHEVHDNGHRSWSPKYRFSCFNMDTVHGGYKVNDFRIAPSCSCKVTKIANHCEEQICSAFDAIVLLLGCDIVRWTGIAQSHKEGHRILCNFLQCTRQAPIGRFTLCRRRNCVDLLLELTRLQLGVFVCLICSLLCSFDSLTSLTNQYIDHYQHQIHSLLYSFCTLLLCVLSI